MAKEEAKKPYIITDEAEARAEYGKLKAMNFEIYIAARPLTEEEFVLLCGIGDGEVVVRSRGYLSEGHWETSKVNVPAEEATEAYVQIVDAGYELVLPPTLLTEDEFVTLAAGKGAIDLMRVRADGRAVRYYGTQIGRSNTPVTEYSGDGDRPFSENAFAAAIEEMEMPGFFLEED